MSEAISMEQLAEIYNRHVSMVYKICFVYMKNAHDAEDCVQDTFIRCLERSPEFENEEHEKAWLIRVASNICKNMLKKPYRHNQDIDEAPEIAAISDTEQRELVEEVMALPDKYRDVIYLFYFEGYQSAEIAEMFNTTDATIRTRLRRGRALLKSVLLEGGVASEERV